MHPTPEAPASFLSFHWSLGPFDIYPSHILYVIALLLVFLWILDRLFFRPLSSILESRDERVRAGQAAREEAERTTALRVEEVQRRIQAAHREAAAARETLQKDASGEREDILRKARGEAQASLTAERARVESQMREARAELEKVASALAVQIAEKILGRKVSA